MTNELKLSVLQSHIVIKTLFSLWCSIGDEGWQTDSRIPACSLTQALTFLLDITTPPSQSFLRKLSQLTRKGDDQQRLLELASVCYVHTWQTYLLLMKVALLIKLILHHFSAGLQVLLRMESILQAQLPGDSGGVSFPGDLCSLPSQPATPTEAPPLLCQLLPWSLPSRASPHRVCCQLPYPR